MVLTGHLFLNDKIWGTCLVRIISLYPIVEYTTPCVITICLYLTDKDKYLISLNFLVDWKSHGQWDTALRVAVVLMDAYSGFVGEGFHNYHHTFPYDYATSEYGCKLNLTTCFIDSMCYLGLANECKRVAHETIDARVKRTGDGSIRSGWKVFFFLYFLALYSNYKQKSC